MRPTLAELADGLAHEEDELRDDLLAARLAGAFVEDLAEHPGVALRGAADHHGRGARRREDGLGPGPGGHVARGDHGHVDQVDQLGRERVVRRSRVHLLRRARVQRQRRRTGLDEPRADVEAGPRAVFEPAAHLHARPAGRRVRDRCDDLARAVRVVEQGRAGARSS